MKSGKILLYLLIALLQLQVHAATRYVKNTASGTASGNSWANASSDLQLMIDQSNAGDEVWVATGFYKPTRLYWNTTLISLNDRNNSFVLKPNVKIYGGFFGNETTLGARVWQSNQTVLDGDIGTYSDSSDNCYSVVRCTTAVGTAAIDGFYIRNGNGSGLTPGSAAQAGSGIYILSGSPTVENCVFTDNIALDGGAIYIQSGSPVIRNCQFYHNSALNEGGAINGYIPGAYIVDRCWFADNKALNGGAIANQYSQLSQTLLVKNSVFQGNYASGASFSGGGAVYNYDNINAEYINCTFSGNRAASYGGAIFTMSSGGGDVLKNCIIWGNTAATSGMNLLDTFGATAVATYSIIEGGFTGTGNSGSDPAFAHPRPASWAPTVSGDYKLLPCSPAINAGNNTYLSAGDNLDFYGNARIDNVTVDIGAFETTTQSISPDANGRVYVNRNVFIQGSGSSWGTAQRELAEVLRAAQSNTAIQEIWVAAGAYQPLYDLGTMCTGNDFRDKTFRIRDGLKVYGGFAGTETALTQRDLAMNSTILDGDLGAFGDTSDNAYHVVSVYNCPSGVTIDGFTIKNGVATGTGAYVLSNPYASVQRADGGGLWADLSSNVALRNMLFENNTATSSSGLFMAGGTMENCVFRNNLAYNRGGALSLFGNTNATNCTFSGNAALTTIVEVSAPNARFVNCLFTGNYSSWNVNYNTSPIGMINTHGLGNNSTWVNCVISGNYRNNASTSLVSIVAGQNSGNTNLRNCILWGNADITSPAGSGTTVANSIVQGSAGSNDPQFLNALSFSAAPFAGGDYRVSRCSPAINTGDNVHLTANDTLDITGNTRVRETVVDIGAYEYAGALPGVGGIVYVDSSKTVSGDGESWVSAVKELADALRAARTDTSIREIWVAKGTYKPLYSADSMLCNGYKPQKRSFVIPNGVKVYGGFAGNETSISQRNWQTQVCRLDGDGGNPAVTTDDVLHVLIAAGVTDTSTTIDGFTISRGFATGGTATGMSVNGAIIYDGQGAGVHINGNAGCNVVNCTIEQNAGGLGSSGGGMFIYQSTPRILNSKVLNNGSSYESGICNYAASPYIAGCVISGNSSSYGAGIANLYAANPVIVNCVISGNKTTSSISGGGGIWNFNGAAPQIISCTIVGNYSSNRGGGIYNEAFSSPTIKNSIVWFNDAVAGNDNIDTAGNSNPAVMNSIVQGGYAPGTNVMDINPSFYTVVNPALAPTTNGDLRLVICSPAINSGDNSAVPSGITKDVAGNIRVQESAVDLGAYENTGFVVSNTPGDSIACVNYGSTCTVLSNQYIPKFAWTNLFGLNSDKIIIGIQDTNQVMISSFPIYVHSKVSNNYGTGALQHLANPFGQAGHYYPINRTWSLSAANPITAPVNLRFYISENDSIQLAAVSNFGGLQNLVVYKVNGNDPYATAATGYKEYTYAATADTNHFTVGTHQGHRYVEFWVTRFSSGTIALKSSSPLNIRLGDFTAVNLGKKNRLDWNSLDEAVTDHFMVERSSNGKDFQILDKIQARGEASSYTYWDESPLNGKNYYRLKMTSADGRVAYSKIVSVFMEDGGVFVIEAYPNPAGSELHIELFGVLAPGAHVVLTDLTGKSLLHYPVTGKQSTLNVDHLPAGMYFIKYFDEERQQTVKFQKL